jgi:hypothetical protein
MATFESRGLEHNTWNPEVCGVNFAKRLHKFLGEVAMPDEDDEPVPMYTVWVVDDKLVNGQTLDEQITPDNSRIFLSLLDDDSDTITIYDRRDNLWFNFMRLAHPDVFDSICQGIAPWSVMTTALTPSEQVYKRFLDSVTEDTAQDEMFIPEGWE